LVYENQTTDRSIQIDLLTTMLFSFHI